MPRFGKSIPPALKPTPQPKISASSQHSNAPPSSPSPSRTPTSSTFSTATFSTDPDGLDEADEDGSEDGRAESGEAIIVPLINTVNPNTGSRASVDPLLTSISLPQHSSSHYRQHSAGSSLSAGQSASDSDEDEEGDPIPLRRSSSYSSYSSSLLHPPFYNRPPTPLPPSPSLTSLFRPPFSRTPSQRTSPSDSDAESRTTTTSLLFRQSHANARLPRAHPKVPTYEYYGFVLYVFSSLAFLIYILWAYLPAPFLHSYVRITYYPSRWWALAIPCQLVMTVLYIFAALASYNTGHLTRPMGSIENVVDNVGQVAVLGYKINRQGSSRSVRSTTSSRAGTRNSSRVRGSGISAPGTPVVGKRRERDPPRIAVGESYDWDQVWDKGTDAILDIPMGGVCEVLYGEGADTREMKVFR